MRRLLTSARNPAARLGPPLPRTLVQFWDNASAIPNDVQACLDSWAPIELKGFERVLFDDGSARVFIAEHFGERHLRAFDCCGHPAMRADYFRLCFMLRQGGVYVDADDVYQGARLDHLLSDGRLRVQALVYDVPSGSMVTVTRALDEDEDGRIFYINNNPIMTAPNHPVIAAALERSTALVLGVCEMGRDIQSLTGPGNLTASLVAHAAALEDGGNDVDFELLADWDTIAISKWPLGYRDDARNWRLWANGAASEVQP